MSGQSLPIGASSPSQAFDIEHSLLQSGLMSAEQLGQAKVQSHLSGTPLVRTLLKLGCVGDRQMATLLARLTATDTVDLSKEPLEQTAGEWVSKVSLAVCERHMAIPFVRRDNTVLVAMSDPTDVVALDQVRRRLGIRCRPLTTTERDIRKALDRLGQAKATISGTIVEIIQQAPLDPPGGENTAQEPDDAPTIHLVNQLIGQAVELGASDIHFEPTESALLVRMRIDGILHQEHWLPKLAQSATLTRLKILAMMDVTETRVPQDGRVSVEVDHRRINLRVSSLPTQHGESIVLRILDANDAVQGMDDLGLDAPFKSQLLDVMDAPHGVVIVTGPTGSGKTTTLYAMLKHLNNPDVSIFTLEDPVEIPVPGIRQTQVREEVGLTFGASLRSLLRQDPDIILVGETRDRETAELMIRAALTGHLVFTTLHTNDAPGAIPRLIDMGVEPYLLPSSLVAVLAQRLVRRLCRSCRRPVDDTRSLLAGLNVRIPDVNGATLSDAAGCPACHHAGYRGRQAIFEMMRLDESFHSLIIQRSAHSEFRRLARSTGMRTMFEDGLRHALAGTTSLRELLRVARPD